MRPFEYFEPENVEGVVRILAVYGEEAKVLAGGLDLVNRMLKGESTPKCVVSLQKIQGLDYIEGGGIEGLGIGALTTLRGIEFSPAIMQDYMLLHEATHQIASISVKNMGTAVGNICVATPASDVALCLLALDAQLGIAGLGPERQIPIEGFFTGVNQTILQPSEIVTKITIPAFPSGTGTAFYKLARTAGDIAKVNVAVRLRMKINRCEDVRIALGSVAPTVIRARKAEGILQGQKLEQKALAAAAEAAAEETRPINDVRSSADYRRKMVRVLVRRTVEKAAERVKA